MSLQRSPQRPGAKLLVVALVVTATIGCGRSEPSPSVGIRSPGRASSASATTAGENAQYVYDGAGNILQIAGSGMAGGGITPISISSFSPQLGGVGQIVTVLGSGFSPIASDNTVGLGGATATILSATATQVVFVVPDGATTGKITLANSTGTAASSGDFTVTAGVAISDFTPKMGEEGTHVFITGVNFDPHLLNDSVQIGSGHAYVTYASTTWLSAIVTAGSTSGKVTVSAHGTSATSADDFVFLPGSYTPWDIGYTGRTSIGSATVVTLASAGQAGLVLFDGVQGQSLSLYVYGVTFPGSTQVEVYMPNGMPFFSGTVASAQDSKLLLPALPSTGTYTIAIEPEPTRTGTLNLTVLHEASAVLPSASASSLVLVRGQNGAYTFTATAGDTLALACTALSTDPAGSSTSLTINTPDGSYLWSSTVTTPTSWQLPQMPVTGTYRLLVQPSGTAAASTTFLLTQPNVGALVLDGAATQFQTTNPGQSGRYMFAGSAGDLVGLGVATLATAPTGGNVTFNVYKPDGSSLWSVAASSPNSWQLPQLPMTGTYTLSIQPAGTATASASIVVSRTLTGALATDGTPTAYQSTRVGQAGVYSFTAAAGQRFTMQATLGPTFPLYGVTLYVYPPSGATIAYSQFPSSTDVKLDLGALPTSGTYTVLLVPSNVKTGNVVLRLVPGASDTLTVGDPPKTLTLVAAQNGRYTFAGNAGDTLSLAATAVAAVPSGTVSFSINRPDGSSLWSGSALNPASWQLPVLPTTGTYVLSIQPPGTASVSVTLLLSRPLTGTLASDGTTTTYQTTRAGQTGTYTFSGTAGQRFTMQATAGPLTNSIYVNVCQPNGASVGYAYLNSNNDTKIDLGALPVTGVYTVTLVPSGMTTGQVTLRLVPGASDALVIGDPAKTLTLSAAQNGRYTFAGSAGDQLGLAATAISAVPSGIVYLYLYKPDGTSLWSGGTLNPTSWQLPPLPTTGTYALSVQPPGTASAAVTIMLSRPLGGVLATDGTTTTFQTSRPGQPGVYTFTGTAGQRFTMQTTAGQLANSITVNVCQPSGASLGYTYLYSNNDLKSDLGALPASGVYTVTLVPAVMTTGQVALRLVAGASDTLAIGDSPKILTLGAAQNGRYSFAGNSGDLLTVGVSALSTTPPGAYLNLNIYKPDGTLLSSSSASGVVNWQAPQLPTSGTFSLAMSPNGTAAASVTIQLVRR